MDDSLETYKTKLAGYGDNELRSILGSLDVHTFPDRYRAVLDEIAKRKAAGGFGLPPERPETAEMSPLTKVGIGCLIFFVLGVVTVFVLITLAVPFAKNMKTRFDSVGPELSESLDAELEKHGRDMSKLPLDTTGDGHDMAGYWTPKFARYAKRFGTLKSFGDCSIAGEYNSTTNLSSNPEKSGEFAHGRFACQALTDSGTVELGLLADKAHGKWTLADLKLQE